MMEDSHILAGIMFALAIVFLGLIVWAYKRLDKGRELYSWGSTMIEDIKVNPWMGFLLLIFVILTLMRILDLSESTGNGSVSKTAAQAVIFLLLIIFLTYIIKLHRITITTRGIAYSGRFIFWEMLEGYSVDAEKKHLVIKFKGKWTGRLKFYVLEPERVDNILSNYLKRLDSGEG